MRGFDPKWSLVGLLFRFEASTSGLKTPCEKTNRNAALYNGAEISFLSPHFPGGALRLADQASPSKYAMASFSPLVFFGADLVIENQFVLTSWGVGGRRVIANSSHIIIYLLPDDSSVHFSVKLNGSSWVDIGYVLPDPDAFLNVRHDLRLRSTSTVLSIELDGIEVAASNHGVLSFDNAYQQFMFGNAFSLATDQVFIGYIGQFRLTVGDLRAEDAGDPIQRFDSLAALDPNREKVVLHSHFDGANNATAATDTTGASLIFSGGAVLKDTDAKFGVSSLSLNNGTVHCDGIDFSAQRFTIEFFEKRTENDVVNRYLVSLMDEAGVDHALSIASPYFGPVTLRKDGVDVSTSTSGTIGPTTTWQHWAIVRDGEYVAVFVGGQRSLLVNIGVNPLLSNGRFVLGKGGSVAPAAVSKDWIDECRITIGEARYNVLSTSIVPPTERFNEYGPRALSGTVRNPDGTPRPNTLVRCYHLASGRLVSQGYSDENGAFVLPTSDTTAHFWVAHHPTSNALIRDRITPALVGG